jgi:hypothetical protein
VNPRARPRAEGSREAPNGLVLDVARQCVVERKLRAVQIKPHRPYLPVGEETAHLARLRVGEGDQRFFGAAEVEGGVIALDRLFQAAHVAVHIPVQELQEEAEVIRVPFMGRAGQEQEMVGLPGEEFPQPVALRLVLRVAGAHPMGLVHDDQVPGGATQTLQDVLPLRPVHRGDDLGTVLPGVDAVGGFQVLAPQDVKPFPETVPHLPLPLEGQVGRDDDEGALDQSPEFQLLEEQSGHDGLSGAGVVGQEKTDAGEREDGIVDGFQLVGERVHAGDREGKVRVVLVGQAQAGGLQAEAEAVGVAVKGGFGGNHPQGLYLFGGQKALVIVAGSASLPADPQVRAGLLHPHDPQGLGEDCPLQQHTGTDRG